jgi:hypothetical protein
MAKSDDVVEIQELRMVDGTHMGGEVLVTVHADRAKTPFAAFKETDRGVLVRVLKLTSPGPKLFLIPWANIKAVVYAD